MCIFDPGFTVFLDNERVDDPFCLAAVVYVFYILSLSLLGLVISSHSFFYLNRALLEAMLILRGWLHRDPLPSR